MKKIIAFLLAFVMAFSLSACAPKEEKVTEEISLYFAGKSSSNLIYEKYEREEDKIKGCLTNMKL